jgi:hypothetical protein
VRCLPGVLFAFGLAVGNSLVVASAAGAACQGPTLEQPASAPVDRGTTIVVRGSAFGDDCHDTGPPPEGEGVLGNPITGIELVVSQGATEVLIARGHADAEYQFEANVVVPVRLHPGPARLMARWSAGQPISDRTTQTPLVLSETPAIDSGEPAVVAFGSLGTTAARGGSGDGPPWPAIGIAVAVGLVALSGFVADHRRRRATWCQW